MIRIRRADGQAAEIDIRDRFVEICDTTGRVGLVLHATANGGIGQIGPGSRAAARYAQLMKVEFCALTPVRADRQVGRLESP